MLLATATATIALVAVRAVLSSAGEDSSRSSLESASRAAAAAGSRVAAQLILNPTAPYTQVLADEATRICPTQPSLQVQAGEPWPTRCGNTWTYIESPANRSVVVKITPPSPSSPELVVSSAARVGGVSAGYIDHYRLNGTTRPSLFSASDVDLAELSSAGGSATLRGILYSTEQMKFSSGVNTNAALLASEQAVTNTSGLTEPSPKYPASRRIVVPTADPLATPARDAIRALFPSALPADGLRSAAGALGTIACAADTGSVFTADDGDSYLSSLCLHAGHVLTSTTGTVTVPSVQTWLLLPGATTAQAGRTLDVYYQLDPAAVPGSSCSGCNLRALSSDAVNENTHPGIIGSWTKLGTFLLPSSGVLATDATTHIGLCGQAFLNEGSCAVWGTGTTPGVTTTSALTVLAGSVSDPADVYLSGPVHATTGRLGVLATGDVYVPYWAMTRSGDLTIDVDLTILGSSNHAPLASFPLSAPGSSSNTAGVLTINGSIAAQQLSTHLPSSLFTEFAVNTPAPSRSAISLLPVPNFVWGLLRTVRMGAAELSNAF